jgi:uncharacterized membrane protein
MIEIYHIPISEALRGSSGLRMDQGWAPPQVLIGLLNGNPELTEGPLLFIHREDLSDDLSLLLALDAAGQLVMIGVLPEEVSYSMFQALWDKAWSSCLVGYNELQRWTREFIKWQGKESEELSLLHQARFSLEAPLQRRDFNKRQRLFFISPHLSKSLRQRISRLSFFVDVRMIQFQRPSAREDNKILTVEKSTCSWGLRLQGLASLLSDLTEAVQQTHWWTTVGRLIMSVLDRLAVRGLTRERIAALVLASLILSYGTLFSFLTIRQYQYFGTFGFDLGLYDQGIWLLSHGKTAFVTISGEYLFERGRPFILLLVSPLYWLWDDVRALLIFQSFFLALGALPVYRLSKEVIGNVWVSVLFSAAYLLYPALEWQNYWHFHPEALATTLLLYCFYFGIKGRPVLLSLVLLLSLMCTEQALWVGILLGISLMLLGRIQLGVLASGLSFIWPFISNYLMTVYGLQTASSEFDKLFTLFQPQVLISSLLKHETWVYLIRLLAPLAFLPLMGLKMVLPALFPFLENLNRGGYALSIQYHHQALIIPFVFLAGLYAYAQIVKRARTTLFPLSAFLLIFTLISHIVLSPSPVSNKPPWTKSPPPETENIRRAISMIPSQSAVSVHYTYSPHLTHREQVYEFPNPWIQSNWRDAEKAPRDPNIVEYLLLDDRVWNDRTRQLVDTLIKEGRYETIFNQDHVVFMKRKG